MAHEEGMQAQPTDRSAVSRRFMLGAATAVAGGAVVGVNKLSKGTAEGMAALKPFVGNFEGTMMERDASGALVAVKTTESMYFESPNLLIAAKASATSLGKMEYYESRITYDEQSSTYQMEVTGPQEHYTQVGAFEGSNLVFTGKNVLDAQNAKALGLPAGKPVATRSVLSASDDFVTFSYHVRVQDRWKEIFKKTSHRVPGGERVTNPASGTDTL